MLLKEVKEWLTEYKGLNPNELHTFAHNNSENEDLLQALHKLFDSPPFYVQELDPVCHQLFEFYRSPERKLQLFALEFVPSLVWLYLRCLSLLERKVCGGVETFLLGVYNLEIVQADGSPIVETFRIPTLSTASIYHEHSRMPGVSEQLTEHALRQLNLSHTSWRSGPFPQFESINAQNRFSILALVMQRYNKDLDAFHSHALISACRVSHKLSQTGFSLDSDSEPRI
ncbi:hyccin, partial [Aplysia californica]|uniref:Hyccin n=1 Tax=Aplysia californica TaxID=6500 RepID=A0ABM0ZW83_APLCA